MIRVSRRSSSISAKRSRSQASRCSSGVPDGAFGLAVVAEVAVFVGLLGKGRPGQFNQQYVVQTTQQRQAVRDQVVFSIDVRQQFVDTHPHRVVAVPARVVEHGAQFVQALQPGFEFDPRLVLR